MPDTRRRIIKIFVSSPIDVAPERGRVQAVGAKLNREYDDLVQFETVLWEEHFYKADRSFQPQIEAPGACDIVVSIFWTRIGSELPADFARLPDGKCYPSGTAYELLTALECSKSRGVPDVYVFRKTADAAISTADSDRRRQTQVQLDSLEAFWSEWFKTRQGQFKAAFHTFATTDIFEQQIELLLRQWLDTHEVLGPRIAWPKERGSPFRGLAPFEAEHLAVFFGRDRVIEEARRRIVDAAERGSAFLIIVGASGSGKSSVARAGLIPRLTTPGLVPFVDLWRVALMKPGDGQAGPLMALTTSLFAETALPELKQSDYPDAGALADNLSRDGAASVQPILRALERVAEQAQRQRNTERVLKAALLLLLDQFEELLALGVKDSDRKAFVKTLNQLMATGRVWCVATLRADLYEPLLRQEELKVLKEKGAALDLSPPGPAELAEIVRGPAEAARLVFEIHPEKGELDERLLRDAKTADSLPLLQFTLQQLYANRVETDGTTRLTHAVYDGLGGLAGAIAVQAERAVSGLPNRALEALPRLLRRLAEPARDGKTLTLRQILQAEATVDVSETALFEALVNARILIAGTDAEGRPTARLAHDAVLGAWPRAREAAQASREFYRVRAEVGDAQRRWQEYGRPKDRLIQPGVPLAQAEKLVKDFEKELPSELTDYVRASSNRARLHQRLVAVAAGLFFVLAIIATAGGLWALRAEARAVAAFRQAQASLWVAYSRSELRDARVLSAVEYAAKAFEELPNETSRSVLVSALLEVSPHLWASFEIGPEGLEAMSWFGTDAVVFASAKADTPLRTISLSKSGSGSTANQWPIVQVRRIQDGNRATIRATRALGPEHIVSVLDNGAVAFLERGANAAHVRAPSQITTLHATAHAADIGSSGALIVTANNGSDVDTIQCIPPVRGQIPQQCRERSLANVRGRAVAIAADETRFAVADQAGWVSIYDLEGRRLVEPIEVGGTLLALGWAKARDWLAVGNTKGDLVVIDLDTFARVQIAKASPSAVPVTTLSWSPEGLQLAFTCDGSAICVWDGSGGIVNAAAVSPVRRFDGHASRATSIAWSPGGDFIASADESTIRIWSLLQNTDEALPLYAESAASLVKVATSPDGRWVAGGAKDGTVRIWDANSGALLRIAKSSHDAEVAALAWNRSGLVAAAHEAAGITVVPADAREPIREIAEETNLDTRLVFTEDDNTIAMPQHSDKRIALIDLTASPGRTRRYLDAIGFDQVPWGLAVDPRRKTLFASYTAANGEIHVWDLARRESSGPLAYTLREKRDPIAAGSLSVNSDGRWLATSGGDSYIRIYDLRTNSSWRALPMDSNAEPETVAFTPDGTKLAALTADGRVYVWTVREDRPERYATFRAVPDRSRLANRELSDQASWLAWVTNDSIAVTTGTSAINVIGLDPAKWRRRLQRIAPLPFSPLN